MRKPTVFIHRNLGVFNLVMPVLMVAGMLLKLVVYAFKTGYQVLRVTGEASLRVASTIREVRDLHRVRETVESARKSAPAAPDLEQEPNPQDGGTVTSISY